MSLEQAIQALTAAVEANTAALKGAGASKPAAAPAPAPAAKPAAAEYAPKHSKEEMTAALNEVKERFGTPVAKSIVTDVGKAAKMAEITDPKLIDACYDAAKAKLAEAEEV
jgi:hypothetical protein